MTTKCKYIDIRGNEVTLIAMSLDDIVDSLYYNEIVFLDVKGSKLAKLPDPLPANLQILNCEDNLLTELPELPKSLRMLYARKNRIDKFPDVEHCLELENIDLYDNHIYDISVLVPINVHAIDISFNKLRKIEYNKLENNNIKITASFNFLTEVPPKIFRTNMIYDHNEIKETRARVLDVPMEGPNIPTRTQIASLPKVEIGKIVYSNPQSVHTSSVQNDVNKSLMYILNYNSRNRIGNIDKTFIDKIKRVCMDNMRKNNFFYRLIPRKWLEEKIIPVEAWCKDSTIHSSHGVTYKTLLMRVWEIIQDHEHREELERVLCEELNDSRGLCFTGRFTRTINCLSGFIEEVRVGISEREQMQNQIASCVEKCRKERFEIDITKNKVNDILDEFQVPLLEREAWIEAIE